MNDPDTIFYLIGVSVSAIASVAAVAALGVYMLGRVWRLCKDTFGLVELMWAWRLYKEAAIRKAKENKGRLP